MKKMIILDGNSIMFRAYFATAYTGNLMQARSGLYTNAIYGFVNMIQHIIQTPDMTNIFVAFDKGKKTLRHQEYSEYKGGRKKTPEEFLMQIPYIKEYLDVLGIKHLELDDYEADDIVGSMAVKASPLFDEIMVISGDKDLLQLAHGNIHVYLTKKGLTDLDCYTEENFKEKMGFESSLMTDYKGLLGDTSDNLPGVSGVGIKTACKLLNEYGSLENIIASTDNMKGKIKDAIIADKEQALRSKKLATLYLNIDLGINVEDTLYVSPKLSLLREFYEKMDFNSFIKKLSNLENDEKDLKPSLEEKKENNTKLKNIYINDIEKTIAALKTSNVISVEAELAGENYHKDEFLGLAIVCANNGYFISKDNIIAIKEYLENPLLTTFSVDVKKTYVLLNKIGVNIKKYAYDFNLATYIVNPSFANADYKTMCLHFLETDLPFTEEIYSKKTKYIIPEEEKYANYAISKASLLTNLKEKTDAILKENNQLSLLYEMEIPLAKTLADMEIAGFKINKERLNEVGSFLQQELSRLEKEIYKVAGFEFNISSPKQLGEVLFERLAIAKGKKNKTGYSTSADVLEKLALLHPVPRLVLEYRKYSKLYSTYVVGLLAEIDPKDGNVHTIFKQSLTLTGRLSSTEPNIQNIPVRSEDGRLIRSAFVPSFKDGKLISADYSQIELRILAHVSSCKNMLDAFNNGIDLHASTAAAIYGVSQEEVTKDMRRMAKAVNFGIVYGMSAWGLAEELHILPYQANEFIEKYFEIYPEIKTYLEEVVKNAKINGYTETIFSRRRFMPEINSSNGALRQFAERTAKNAPIQGSAADIIKFAMIKVAAKMKELNLKSKLIVQVHDELVVDTSADEIDVVKNILKETMENIVDLKVKLNASLSEGITWDMK